MAFALLPVPTSTAASVDKHQDVEYQPLISNGDEADVEEGVTKQELVGHDTAPECRKGDDIALWMAIVSVGAIAVATWIVMFSNEPLTRGWFFFHPTLETLSILALSYGVLTLQPTRNPETKAAALTRHQVAILFVAFPLIFLGTFTIWLNKTVHHSHHARSWHGLFGYITTGWMVVQILLGGGSVWFNGRIFGGNPRAKLVWKYHRLSGYLLLPLLLLTTHLGGAWSHWGTQNSPLWVRILAYCVAPALLLVAVFVRVRPSKMKFF